MNKYFTSNLITLFIFIPVLAFILLLLNFLLASHKPDEAKISSYECGYDNIQGQTRSTFHIHFFIVALLFLVFDLEIILLVPISMSLYHISLYGFSIGVIFFIVLTVGFIFEIGIGAIKLSNINVKSYMNKDINYNLHDV